MRIIRLTILCMILVSCTLDRVIPELSIIPPDTNYEIVHYWNFNNAATTANLISPTITKGGASLSYAGSAFDAINEGSDLNARNEDPAGNALRLRNPSGNFTLTIPTTNYKDILVTYAVMRTSAGAQVHRVSYSLDGVTFINSGLSETEYGISESFVVKQLNFSSIEGVSNNPNFRIRIQFDVNADGLTGNNRFDNITVDGISLGNNPDPDPDTNVYLLHYWHFNALPAGGLTNPIPADFSAFGAAIITYPGTGAGFMDQVDPGSALNLRQDVSLGLGLRFRNPSNTREAVFSFPTTGYKNLLVKFATTRTNNGNTQQTYSYSTDGVNYTQSGLPVTTFTVTAEYELVTLDLSSIPAVNNQSAVFVRIQFTGPEASNPTGNNRIDNVTVEGNIL